MAKEIVSKFTDDEDHLYEMPESWAAVLRGRTYQSESPSSIRSFISCPLRWWVERYSPAEPQPPSFPLVFGSFVHRIIEVFYSEPAENRTPELLQRVFKNGWDDMKQRAHSGIIPLEMQSDFDYLRENDDNPDRFMGMFFKRARICIDNLMEMDLDPSELKVLSNETWCRTKVNGITVRGKIDRVTEDKFGRVVIDDYKTGRVPDLREMEDGTIDYMDDGAIAMILYALMYGEEMGGGQIVDYASMGYVRLLYVLHNEIVNMRITPSMIQDAQHLMDQVTREMLEVKETGKIRITGADTPYQDQCNWCPIQAKCPLWQNGSFEPAMEMVQL